MDPFSTKSSGTASATPPATSVNPATAGSAEPSVTPIATPASPSTDSVSPDPGLASPNLTQASPPPPNNDRFGFMRGPLPKILVLLLVILIPITAFVGINYKTIFKPRAQTACTPGVTYYFDVLGHSPNFENGSFVPSDKAWERVKVTNNCDRPVTAYEFKYWCTTIDKHRSDYWGFCLENKVMTTESIDAHTQKEIYLEQLVGNTGTCGSAQTDIQLESSIPDDANLIYAKTIFGVAAAASAECSTTTALTCNISDMTPSGTTVAAGGETRSLTAAATGGTSPYTFTWTTTGGTVNPTTGTTTTWKAPATLPSGGASWDISVTAKDTANQTASGASCTKTLSYNVAPKTYTYKTCLSNACVTKDCNPKTTDCSSQSNCTQDSDCKPGPSHKECQNQACVSVAGSGSDACTSDASCKPAATPPPVPQAGSPLPTVLTVGAGALLTILGAALLL